VAAGRRVLAELRLAVAALRPGLEVLAASVDVQRPALAEVVESLVARQRTAVVVPLLLSAGYHVHVDVAGAAAASGGLVLAAAALGPDDVLAEVLDDRLVAAGASPADAVVMAAAGSSDARAAADVEAVAGALTVRRAAPVIAGYLSAARPTVAEAVASSRRTGQRVALATYLLAPGLFSRRLQESGADLVADPLGADLRVAGLVLRRYDEALARSTVATAR
jgi:sirohydrochlorin ferrochelatase